MTDLIFENQILQIKQKKEQRDQRTETLMDMLKLNVHYFVVDDAAHLEDAMPESRSVLKKAGAELITEVLGLTRTYSEPELIKLNSFNGVTTVEMANVSICCELKDSTGNLVAKGYGARLLNEDAFDYNLSVKMAMKNALICAAIEAAGLSEKLCENGSGQARERSHAEKTDEAEQEALNKEAEKFLSATVQDVVKPEAKAATEKPASKTTGKQAGKSTGPTLAEKREMERLRKELESIAKPDWLADVAPMFNVQEIGDLSVDQLKEAITMAESAKVIANKQFEETVPLL